MFSRPLSYAFNFGGGLDPMDVEDGRAGHSCLVSCTNVISLLLMSNSPFLHFSSLYLLDFRDSPLQVLLGSPAMWGARLGFAVISIRPGHRVDSSSVLSLFLLVFPVNRLAKRKVPTAGSALSAICVVRHLLYNQIVQSAAAMVYLGRYFLRNEVLSFRYSKACSFSPFSLGFPPVTWGKAGAFPPLFVRTSDTLGRRAKILTESMLWKHFGDFS